MKPKFLRLALIFFVLIPTMRLAALPVKYVKIYDFGGVNAIPSSGLLGGPCGTLFGVTYGGAASDGTGSIFEFKRNQNDHFHDDLIFYSLYRFDISGSPANDGQYPYAGLAMSPDGTTLFGTTQQGGSGAGAIFNLNFAQALAAQNNGAGYAISHTFNGTTEGGGAQGALTAVSAGTATPIYFGTMSESGALGGGGVFWYYPPTGETHPVRQFSSSGSAGAVNGSAPLGQLVILVTPIVPPPGPLLNLGAKANTNTIDLSTITLYGTTRAGGSNNWGTVYSVKANGSNFMVLHHFNFSTTDGAGPKGGMVLSSNTLYGTTASGGANYAGTIFKIHTDGSGFQILKNMDYANTGSSPQGDLILSGTTLYGTTYSAGTNGGGTVYSMSTSGSNFMVLHSFTTPTANQNGNYTNSDGGWSVAGLYLSDHTLYGTTPYGGTNGVGTAYEIRLPAPPFLRIAPTNGNFKLSWPSWASNYVLQHSSKLTSTNWSTNSLAVSDNGTNRSVMVARTPTNTFFRLFSTNSPGNP